MWLGQSQRDLEDSKCMGTETGPSGLMLIIQELGATLVKRIDLGQRSLTLVNEVWPWSKGVPPSIKCYMCTCFATITHPFGINLVQFWMAPPPQASCEARFLPLALPPYFVGRFHYSLGIQTNSATTCAPDRPMLVQGFITQTVDWEWMRRGYPPIGPHMHTLQPLGDWVGRALCP